MATIEYPHIDGKRLTSSLDVSTSPHSPGGLSEWGILSIGTSNGFPSSEVGVSSEDDMPSSSDDEEVSVDEVAGAARSSGAGWLVCWATVAPAAGSTLWRL